MPPRDAAFAAFLEALLSDECGGEVNSDADVMALLDPRRN